MEARQGSDQASNFILAGGVIYVQRERGSRLMGGSGVAREAGRTLGGSAFQGLVDSDRISPRRKGRCGLPCPSGSGPQHLLPLRFRGRALIEWGHSGLAPPAGLLR